MRPDEKALTAFGPDGHLDEGGAHAFVDGALGTDEAARAIAHVAACAACAGRVAEARGLAAASTRILGALDDVPGGVIPAADGAAPAHDPRVTALRDAAARAQRARGPGAWAWPVRAAASLLLAAGLGSVVWRATGGRPDVAPADAAPGEASVAGTSAGQEVATAPAADSAATSAGPSAPTAAPAAGAGAAVAAAPNATRPSAARPRVRTSREPADGARRAEAATPAAPAPLADAPPPPPPVPDDVPPPPPPPAPPVAALSAPPPAAMRAPAAKTAARPGVIAGVVRDDAGRPVVDASVTAGTSGTVTDSAGAFVLRDVAEGRTAVRARRIGFAQAATELTVGADTARAALTLRAQSTQLSAVVVGEPRAALPRRGAAGCYALTAAGRGAAGLALPAVVRLTPAGGVEVAAGSARQRRRPEANDAARADAAPVAAGVVRDAVGTARGRWRLAGGTLAVTWDGVGEATLTQASGGWDGPLTVAGGPARVTLRALRADAARCGSR